MDKQYLNLAIDYGNMISVSVSFGLTYSLDHGLVKEGDVVNCSWYDDQYVGFEIVI